MIGAVSGISVNMLYWADRKSYVVGNDTMDRASVSSYRLSIVTMKWFACKQGDHSQTL